MQRSAALIRPTSVLLAASIPRSTWDPQQHDKKWVDSLAKPISDRRAWSAKKYNIGLEPLTPREFLEYSLRNLAYEYNAAMRACETFSDVVPIYAEMKRRGVKMDVDTMYVVLGRAARYEAMDCKDAFALFDEMIQFGAKPDLAVLEIMHTLWDLSAQADPVWREVRRRDLVRWYHRLAARDLAAFGQKGYDKLLLQQIHRYRTNLKSLGSMMHPTLWMSLFAHCRSPEDVVKELCAMLWERAPENCQYTEITSPTGEVLTVPLLGEHLKRFSSSSSASVRRQGKESDDDDANVDAAESSATTTKKEPAGEEVGAGASSPASQAAAAAAWSIENETLEELADIMNIGGGAADSSATSVCQRLLSSSSSSVDSFEDIALNLGLVAALERLVDEPFPVSAKTETKLTDATQPLIALSLVATAWRSEMLFSADVLAQALDIARFNAGKNERRRETDGIRYLRFALQTTSMKNRAGQPSVIAWRNNRANLDDRVVARYIGCRDPWSDTVFCPAQSKQMFGAFSNLIAAGGAAAKKPPASSQAQEESKEKDGETEQQQLEGDSSSVISSSVSSSSTHIITERWSDLMSLLDRFSNWNKQARSQGKFPPSAAATMAGGDKSSKKPLCIMNTTTADGVNELMAAAANFLLRMTSTMEHNIPSNHAIKALSQIYTITAQLKRDIDMSCSTAVVVVVVVPTATTTTTNVQQQGGAESEQPLAPTAECWEALLVTCRIAMDRLAHSRSTDTSVQREADALFGQYSALRQQLVAEARDRHGGKLRMLWLQEA